MGMLALGPFALPYRVAAVLLALVVFSVLGYFAASRIDKRFDRWSTGVLALGFVFARLAYVALRWDSFSADPVRALMFWQGGFEWVAGLLVAIGFTLWFFRSWALRAIALLIVFLGLSVWLGTVALLQDTRYDHELPHQLVLPERNGALLNLDNFRQGPLVVNLWASWCPPCRRELPAMVRQQNLTPQLPFVFANQGEAADVVNAYLQKQGLQPDNVLLDGHSALSRAFQTVGLPVTLFFMDGRLKQVHAGEISPEALAEKTASLLDGNHF